MLVVLQWMGAASLENTNTLAQLIKKDAALTILPWENANLMSMSKNAPLWGDFLIQYALLAKSSIQCIQKLEEKEDKTQDVGTFSSHHNIKLLALSRVVLESKSK